MDRLTLTSVNMACLPMDTAFNLESHLRQIKNHSREDILLFPELSLTGYVKDRNWLREHRSDWERALARLTEETSRFPGLTVAAGSPLLEGEDLYIAHHVIAGGTILFTHRKTVTGPTERSVFKAGKKVKLLRDLPLRCGRTINLGIQICYETHFPEISLNQADGGADLILAPFASPRESAEDKLKRFEKYLPARAYDGSFFLACCNQIFPSAKNGLSPGAAMILDPRGNILARVGSEEESLCTASLDLDELDRIRSSSMGYFRRWAPAPRI